MTAGAAMLDSMRMKSRSARALQQQGIALPVVIVLVLMSSLLVLWGYRSAYFNEAIVGNDTDHQRAFEAAQALLQDAEFDVRGQRADGEPCTPSASDGKICRRTSSVWFIDEDRDFVSMVNTLTSTTTGCSAGICAKRTGNQDFWSDASVFSAMTANGVGARYGEYTGATRGSASNSILNDRSSGNGGWYWVEVMQYAEPGGGGGVPVDASKMELNLKPNLVYRITAIARGLKPNTRVVLQSTLALQRLKD